MIEIGYNLETEESKLNNSMLMKTFNQNGLLDWSFYKIFKTNSELV